MEHPPPSDIVPYRWTAAVKYLCRHPDQEMVFIFGDPNVLHEIRQVGYDYMVHRLEGKYNCIYYYNGKFYKERPYYL